MISVYGNQHGRWVKFTDEDHDTLVAIADRWEMTPEQAFDKIIKDYLEYLDKAEKG